MHEFYITYVPLIRESWWWHWMGDLKYTTRNAKAKLGRSYQTSYIPLVNTELNNLKSCTTFFFWPAMDAFFPGPSIGCSHNQNYCMHHS